MYQNLNNPKPAEVLNTDFVNMMRTAIGEAREGGASFEDIAKWVTEAMNAKELEEAKPLDLDDELGEAVDGYLSALNGFYEGKNSSTWPALANLILHEIATDERSFWETATREQWKKGRDTIERLLDALAETLPAFVSGITGGKEKASNILNAPAANKVPLALGFTVVNDDCECCGHPACDAACCGDCDCTPDPKADTPAVDSTKADRSLTITECQKRVSEMFEDLFGFSPEELWPK